MIMFVTVGTSVYDFQRIFQFSALLTAENRDIISHVVLQTGYSQPLSTGAYGCLVEAFKFTDRNHFDRLLCKSDLILTHGAAGTILQCAALGRRPFILPRRSSLGEHSDDHQVKSAATFEADNLCVHLSGAVPKLTKEVVLASRVRRRRLSGAAVFSEILGGLYD